ncbi:Protein EXORDIUM-like [Actinidia chinensis var. chinensis]|uniref:Protein EXORDIUM-like n=1 Tax=Actinidia chinensis var. chinensis TaxID=1590841 RepID=A0A2R6R2Y7_ACTCC|nr:Protein EXORDIUM-like [Actinidia chinensis var. chinensis]
MASIHYFTILTSLLLLLLNRPNPASATTRKLAALVQPPPLTLKYHNGPLLNGNVTVNLLWYGKFSPTQRSIIADFIQSLNAPHAPTPSVASWWQTTERYKFGSGSGSTVILGSQILDENYSLGKSLTTSQIIELASKSQRKNSIHVVLTAEDVTVDGFCMSRCGTHGSGFSDPKNKREKFAYAWVGNPVTQCPGQCAWPFHQPLYGPQTPPLVAPNGDVGVDGMVINLATVLTGTVTNPFNNGYFQGPETAPLEAVTACTGMFGSGSYPGYAGSVLVDKSTGASYNSQGVNGRKYLLPAMWDPKTSTCKTLV